MEGCEVALWLIKTITIPIESQEIFHSALILVPASCRQEDCLAQLDASAKRFLLSGHKVSREWQLLSLRISFLLDLKRLMKADLQQIGARFKSR
jgi:hypothetical protein